MEKERQKRLLEKKRKEEYLEKIRLWHEDDQKGKEIMDKIFVGSERAAANREWLMEKSVFYILNVAREVKNYFEDDKVFRYKK
jgi:hypothetical protein